MKIAFWTSLGVASMVKAAEPTVLELFTSKYVESALDENQLAFTFLNGMMVINETTGEEYIQFSDLVKLPYSREVNSTHLEAIETWFSSESDIYNGTLPYFKLAQAYYSGGYNNPHDLKLLQENLLPDEESTQSEE